MRNLPAIFFVAAALALAISTLVPAQYQFIPLIAAFLLCMVCMGFSFFFCRCCDELVRDCTCD